MNLDLIKSVENKIRITGSIYKFQWLDTKYYYIKKIYAKEFEIGRKLGTLDCKEFLVPLQMFEESYQSKNHLFIHATNKTNYYMVCDEMMGEELDIVIPLLTDDEFKIVITKIVNALELAWNQLNFVHGDLHLRNIFVSDLQPTIFDYGFSQITKCKKHFDDDIKNLLTNLSIYSKGPKLEFVFELVDKYLGDRYTFQEFLYPCVPQF